MICFRPETKESSRQLHSLAQATPITISIYMRVMKKRTMRASLAKSLHSIKIIIIPTLVR